MSRLLLQGWNAVATGVLELRHADFLERYTGSTPANTAYEFSCLSPPHEPARSRDGMMRFPSESFWVRHARVAALPLWLGAVVGCHSGATGGSPPVTRPALDLQSDAPWASPYAEDTSWRRAANGDEFEQARLAQREGAVGLCDALELGGSLGRTALAALSYARDRREALGRLCEFALNATPVSRARLIGAMYEVAMDGPRNEPSIDPMGDAACLTKLGQLSERQGQSPEERDRLAVLRATLQRGVPGSRGEH